MRTNHQNFSNSRRNFAPTVVLSKSGIVPISTVRQSSSRAAAPVSTARPINIVAPKPIVNVAKTRQNAFHKTHSLSSRPFHQQTSLKNRYLVNTAKVKSVNTTKGKSMTSGVGKQGTNVVKSSACWVWRPKIKVQDHISKKSGSYICKRLIMLIQKADSRNKSFLSDYQEYNGEFVTFAGSSKRGKITGKGKIKTGKLDFEDVYFVKELKFKPFSVSQMCDKKNSVLFTETKCLILSPDFKLPDENQVLLKFCGIKWIKMEFNNVRTPQQNGVAQRKNKTLIEAARTMLADSLLPIPFWAEAVNTACYIHSDAGQEGKEKVSDQEYILLPVLNTSSDVLSCNEEVVSSSKDDAGKKSTIEPTCVEGGKIDDLECLDQKMKSIDDSKNTNSTNSFNTTSPTVNTASDKDGSFQELMMPNLEDTRIFDDAYNDRDEGAEADYNNLETVILVSPIPSTRIHKDHPKEQIIREVNSVVQTRKMAKQNKARWNQRRNKRGQRGIVVRNKARLVAQGHRQEEGIDYDEFFALIAWIEAIRFVDPEFLDRVYKVEKALYGLHQAPRAWYETLSNYLLDNGFRRRKIDKTLFIKKIKDDILLVKVYVDDIIFGSSKRSLSTEFEQLMHNIFQMSSMGELTFFLGLVKLASTPMETHKPLSKDSDGTDVDVYLYRSMIGLLMYLTSSRPDIMFDVYAWSRFQVQPKVSHIHAMKRIFRYLKGHPTLGLWYPKDSPLELIAYSDNNYAGASLDRKSTTGGCQFLGSRLISWQCKKQTIVANSTTKAKYIAASNCCGQVLWLRNQLLDYGYNFMQTKIHMDNESAICMVKNHVYHSKTKHIEIRHHFIRDSYEKRLIEMVKIHTDSNVADLLTKAFDISSTQQMVINSPCLTEKKELAIPGKMTTGKEFLIPLMAGSLPKTISAKFVDQHNMVAYLEKSDDNTEFHQIVDFLSSCSIAYAFTLTNLPEIFNDTYETPCHTKKVFLNMARKSVHFLGNVTPLFETMLVQHKAPEDEAVNQEEGDIVEGAITTDANLEATHDSDNIINTQTTVMLNVDIPRGIDTGGSPRHQETIRGTSTQIRSESVLEQPNKPPLPEGPSVHIEDSPKQGRIIKEMDKDKNINLVSEQGKVQETTEHSRDDDNDETLAETLLDIKRSLAKDKVKGIMQETELPKKLKKKEIIQLSLDEELAQKLYAEELVKEEARQELERYNLDKALELQRQLDQRKENVPKGDQAKEIDWNDPQVLRYYALQNKPFSKAKVKKNTITYLKNQRGYKQSYFKGMKYEDIRPLFERIWDQVHTFVPKYSEIEREVMKRAEFDLQQGSSKKQRLDQQTEEKEEEVEAQGNSDQEVEELKLYMRIIPKKYIAIEAIPLAIKPPVIIEYKIVKERKISTYHITRADGSTRRYISMINLLENINREDLETLWKLVKDKYGNARPEEGYERVL
uniref:Reverse transcriptase Ty1/copia-type domain-containing protein n=1 Tax=Tanacetum cinerariifolium TaxID=118510 RepID=A0A699GRG6_TANCI|nr:hypothetical protein [Tanacetum cinerariifolium]